MKCVESFGDRGLTWYKNVSNKPLSDHSNFLRATLEFEWKRVRYNQVQIKESELHIYKKKKYQAVEI